MRGFTEITFGNDPQVSLRLLLSTYSQGVLYGKSRSMWAFALWGPIHVILLSSLILGITPPSLQDS